MHALPGSRKKFASHRAALNADEALYPCYTGIQHACTCTQTGTHLEDEEHTQKTHYEFLPSPHFYGLDTFNTLEGSHIWGRSQTSDNSYFLSSACLEVCRTLGSQPSLSSSIFMDFCYYYDAHNQGYRKTTFTPRFEPTSMYSIIIKRKCRAGSARASREQFHSCAR